uniref:Uncharacterized protein n=1 Tax=Rhizophora mucronata TaxID=61149 RepID=A0A2P2QQ83_RHIMU
MFSMCWLKRDKRRKRGNRGGQVAGKSTRRINFSISIYKLSLKNTTIMVINNLFH